MIKKLSRSREWVSRLDNKGKGLWFECGFNDQMLLAIALLEKVIQKLFQISSALKLSKKKV